MKTIAALLLTALPLAAADDLAGLLEPIREKGKAPALGALVIVDGKVEGIGAVGVRKAGDDKEVTTEDKWHIGSCTKSMTATLAATFVEEGKIEWTTTIGEVLGGKVRMRDDYKNVSLADLLSHRSGIHKDVPAEIWSETWKDNGKGNIRTRRKEFVAAMLELEPASKPGTQYEYSNAGYVTAGLMLETLADESWEDLMEERLFEPLGMKSAGFGGAAGKGRPDQPWGHHDPDRPQAPGPGDDNPAVLGPGGTVHCSLADLGRYVQMHLLRETGPVLKKKDSYEFLHAAAADNEGYARGWSTGERGWADGPILTHNGTNTMHYCVFWLAPKKKFATIAVTNFGGNGANETCDQVAQALIGTYLK